MTLGPQAQALGGALVLAAWASGACAEQARTPLNTMKDIETAIRACWIRPPIEQARSGMQITVLMSFKRDGALLGQPKVTFESVGATDDERLAYRLAVAEMLKRCTPLPFTEALGNAVAGRPFKIRFRDDRKLRKAERLS